MDQRVDTPTWLEEGESTLLPDAGTAGSELPAGDSTAQASPQRGDTPSAPAMPSASGEPQPGAEAPQLAPAMPADAAGYSSGYADGGYGPGSQYGAAGPAGGMPMTGDASWAPAPDQLEQRDQRGVGSITAPFAALTKGRKKRKAFTVSPDSRFEPELARGAGPQAAPTRRAQLVLSRIEPWSVMKFSFMISLVGWVVLFVAISILYFALSKLGVFHSIESTVGSITSSKDNSGTNAASWFAASRVLGYTMLAGAINVVLITAIATVGAVVYNLVAHLAGGVEVTLKETD